MCVCVRRDGSFYLCIELCVCGVLVCVFLNVVVWRLSLCIVRMFMCVVLRVAIVCVLCIQVTFGGFQVSRRPGFSRERLGPKGREMGLTTFEHPNVVGPPVWPNTPSSHKRKKIKKSQRKQQITCVSFFFVVAIGTTGPLVVLCCTRSRREFCESAICAGRRTVLVK